MTKEMSLQELIEEYQDALPESDKELAKLGLSTQPRRPNIPKSIENVVWFSEDGAPYYEDLTDFTELQLGGAFSFYTNWAAYANALESRARCKLKIMKKQINMVESALKVYLRTKGVKTTNLKEELQTYRSADGHVWHTLDVKITKLEITFLQAETIHKNMRSDLNNISREMTRRQNIMKQEVRGASIEKQALRSTYNERPVNNSGPAQDNHGGSRWRRR